MPPKCPQSEPNAVREGCKSFVNCKCLCCHVGNEALEAEDIEDTGEIVAERHQAPFAANLVEAANQKVSIAGAAFEGAEWMLDKRGTTSHQFVCALHPSAMTFENVFVLPAADAAVRCLRGETTWS